MQDSAKRQFVIAAGVIVIAALTGPFGTITLPFSSRFLFWAALIGWNMAKWAGWLGWVVPRWEKTGKQQLALILLGAVVLNASVALETETAFAAIGRPFDLPDLQTWVIAGTISLTISGVVAAFSWYDSAQPASGHPPEAVPLPLMLRKAQIRALDELLAVEAEDHYVRLHLADGRQPLVLQRFSDALEELTDAAGLRVHRGAWVANHAVDAARREGRNWRLLLVNGAVIPVGGSHLSAVRAQGWLTR